MSTPPNSPDPRDPNRPRDPGAADDEPKYGQRLPQTPLPGQQPPASGQPYGQPYGQQPPASGQPYGQQPQSPYGYQAAQPSGYAYPGPGQVPAGKGAPPREVLTGFWLILAAGLLTAIYMITSVLVFSDAFSFERLSEQEQQMVEDAGLTEEMFGSVYVGTGVVMALLVLLVYLLVAIFIRKGKNWARILGTVFAALSAVGVLVSLLSGLAFTSPLELLSVIASLAGIAGIAMLYRPQSQPYFQSRPRFGPY